MLEAIPPLPAVASAGQKIVFVARITDGGAEARKISLISAPLILIQGGEVPILEKMLPNLDLSGHVLSL